MEPSGVNPRIGTGLAVVALPSAGAGVHAAASSMATGLILSVAICLALICLVAAIRLVRVPR